MFHVECSGGSGRKTKNAGSTAGDLIAVSAKSGALESLKKFIFGHTNLVLGLMGAMN
jgi:hypothetical protein